MKFKLTPLSLLVALWTAAASAAPVVFRVSDPINPGETALLFGDGIGPDVVAEGWRVDDANVSQPPSAAPELAPAKAQPLEVLQASDLSAKVLLPADWKMGLFAVRLKNSTGVSAPIFLNRTEPWWWLAGPNDTAQPGGLLRVFGKNFSENTRAWLKAADRVIPLETLSATKYAAAFRVPKDAAAGDYELWLHNGFGGESGFGVPLKVRVTPEEPWPATEFNVRDFGARGDGVHDDTPAFAAALAKAGANGGGVVFVPSGTYKIMAKLVIPAKTTLRGEKRELVWLFAPKELPAFDSVLAGNGDFAVEDLSIVSQTARRLIACPDTPAIYEVGGGHVPAQMGRNAHLRRLRLQLLYYSHRVQDRQHDPRRLVGAGPAAVVLAGPDMEISDSEIIGGGMPIHLMYPHHCRIEGNHLENGRGGWYCLRIADETVFENNNIEARDLEGTYGGVQGKAYRLYFAGNTWHDAYGDEREAITFDTPYYPTWMGRVGSVKDTELKACDYSGAEKTWTPGELRGQVCLIAFGKGIGQYIPISDNTATTITLARPFAVPPDGTSHLAVRVNKSDVVITGNKFSDASVAVQFYAQCFGFIVDGNQAVRTGGMYGIADDAIRPNGRRYSTCSFNQWLNNDMSEGFVYQQGPFMHGVIGPCAGGSNGQPPVVGVIGNVIRNNRVRDWFTIGALYCGPHLFAAPASSAGYLGRDTIIEGNDIAETPLALDICPLYRDTLLRNNRVKNAAVPLRDDGVNTWISPAERLGYQIQAVSALLGGKVDLAALKAAAANASASDAAALREKLWAEAARATGGRATPELVMALTGFCVDFGVNPSVVSALSTGNAGECEIVVRARTAPWSPELGGAMEIEAPSGWQITKPAAPVTLKPFEISNLQTAILVPAGSDVRTLQTRFTLKLGGVAMTIEQPLDLSRRDILNWIVLGPMPDTAIPQDGAALNLNAVYHSAAGDLSWQPVTLSDTNLQIETVTPGPGTALAVSCLRADEAATIELTLFCNGAAQLFLNSSPVATLYGSRAKTVTLNLEPGDNILFCKSSVNAGSVEIRAGFNEVTGGERSHVRQTPAAELKSVKARVPPAPKPPRP